MKIKKGTGFTGSARIKELPTTFRLPKTGQRDEHFGLSRSWFYAAEADGRLALIHLREKGKTRGTTLVRTSAVLELLEGAQSLSKKPRLSMTLERA